VDARRFSLAAGYMTLNRASRIREVAEALGLERDEVKLLKEYVRDMGRLLPTLQYVLERRGLWLDERMFAAGLLLHRAPPAALRRVLEGEDPMEVLESLQLEPPGKVSMALRWLFLKLL